MKKAKIIYLLGFSLVFVLSGCVVRTYPLTKDRIDQDLSGGNRGYIKGAAPAEETLGKKTDRTTQVVEVELHSPLKFEFKKWWKKPAKKVETEGNRGYITQSVVPEIIETPASCEPVFEKYVVQKNDTLQKISMKYYGTTKKWMKIYDANKDTLKSPNSIRPGKTINIPVLPELKSQTQGMTEPTENLK
ncbi:MAG: LysM peptidoglycan-binding domain-containing protein [Candidatus Omnitrophica bacterium]|nr:LysM peptidoglycan-binding domain-containing protein [Candidatus Omnitrophota bacterium]